MNVFFPDSTSMDPTQFAMHWDTLFEVLALVTIIAIIVERILAVLFETQLFIDYSRRVKEKGQSRGLLKPFIALVLSIGICVGWQLDVLAILFHHAHVSMIGMLATATVVAGGSKGSIKLFRDILGFKSGAYAEYERQKQDTTPQDGGS